MRSKRKSTRAKQTAKPLKIITSWIISRTPARDGFWHVQARTADQLSSFAVVVPHTATYNRTKTEDGMTDVFTMTAPSACDPVVGITMSVVGVIRYDGEWPE